MLTKRKLFQAYRHAVEAAAILEVAKNQMMEGIGNVHGSTLLDAYEKAAEIPSLLDKVSMHAFDKKAQELESYK